ncbi:MAG: AMP-binding protein [Rhodospirillaceae bacterium]|nr:AMP-binding protein [Rhodospirillaceae bacterium]
MTALIDLPDFATARRGLTLPVPEFYNFGFDCIDRRAREADKTAFVYLDANTGAESRHRFSDLAKASNRFAHVLLGLGAKKGDFAFSMIPRIPAWYETLIGCIKTGVVAMPGTNLLQPKDIEYRLNKSRARFAIVTADHAAKVEAVRAKCPHLEHCIVIGAPREGWIYYEAAAAGASDRLDPAAVEKTRADETMLAYFTSGTTAFPKMVPRAHSYAIAHTITARYWQDLRDSDVHWTLSDTGWAKAAWGMIFGQWQIGATILLYNAGPGFDADAHLKLLAKEKVTTFCAPPTIYRTFAQLDLSSYDFSTLRHCISAGEPLNPEVIRVWKEATGTVVHDGYGQTETICVAANVPGMEVRPGSMGLPSPGLTLDVIDDDGRIAAGGEVGHVAIKLTDPWPPGLFTGYFEDPEANARCFRNGWYYTGDTATRDKDGYLWFVGRSDDIISSAAYRISPFEVESALIEHPAVAESAVVGKKDALRGEIVKAYVVLAKGQQPSDALAKELQDFVKNTTAPYKYPREIEFREALPKTISGKIRRVELRADANRG